MTIIASSMQACSRLMGTTWIHRVRIHSRKSPTGSSETSTEGTCGKNRPRTGRFQQQYRQITDSWLMRTNGAAAAVELVDRSLNGVSRHGNKPPEPESVEALDPEKAARVSLAEELVISHMESSHSVLDPGWMPIVTSRST